MWHCGPSVPVDTQALGTQALSCRSTLSMSPPEWFFRSNIPIVHAGGKFRCLPHQYAACDLSSRWCVGYCGQSLPVWLVTGRGKSSRHPPVEVARSRGSRVPGWLQGWARRPVRPPPVEVARSRGSRVPGWLQGWARRPVPRRRRLLGRVVLGSTAAGREVEVTDSRWRSQLALRSPRPPAAAAAVGSA